MPNNPNRSKQQSNQRRRDPEEKRARLLATARVLFIENGFEKTTTKQIATSSGVSEGILFHQFESKLGIFAELIRQYAENAINEFMPESGELLSAEEVLRRLIAFIELDRELFLLVDENSHVLKKANLPLVSDFVVPAIERNIELRRNEVKGDLAPTHIIAEYFYSIVETCYRGWIKSKTKKEKELFIQEGVRFMNSYLDL